MAKIRVLTLWQPWASLIVDGVKKIETRDSDWCKSLEGYRIGIHAAVAYDRDFLAKLYVGDSVKRNKIAVNYCEENVIGRRLLGTALVREARWLSEKDSEDACCAAKGRFGLVLTDVKKIETPIVISGKQGIWFFNWEGDMEHISGHVWSQQSLF